MATGGLASRTAVTCGHPPATRGVPPLSLSTCPPSDPHTDIKPANLLLKSNPSDYRGFTVKLADFGFVLQLTEVRGAGGGEGTGDAAATWEPVTAMWALYVRAVVVVGPMPSPVTMQGRRSELPEHLVLQVHSSKSDISRVVHHPPPL